MNRLAFTLILCLIAAVPSFAGSIARKSGAATLEVRFDGDEPKIALADLITVTLTVEGSPALHTPIAPVKWPATDMWKLEWRSQDRRETLAPGKVRWRLIYHFSPRQPGKIPFQFLDVKYRDGAGAEQTASWKPIPFAVVTQIGPEERAELRGITAIETLPPIAPPEAAWRWWLAGGAACLLLIAAIVGARLLLRRSKMRSPAELALYEWRRLMAMKLPETGRSERFITLLTLLVRRYLERQFALPARCLTTPEFIWSLDQVTVLSAEQKQFLLTFLQRCEAVKFARQPMSVGECGDWACATRDFLAATRSEPEA